MVAQDNIKIDDAVLEQAYSWHRRVERDTAEADEGIWLAYAEWLNADEMHQAAADYVETTLNFVDDNTEAVADKLHDTDVLTASHLGNDGGPIAENTVVRAENRFRKPSMWAAITAIAASFIFALVNLTNLTGHENFVREYQTEPGQHQFVSLEDGSNIHLNTQSKLTVTFAQAERRVDMGYGEALFEVAHDGERPFIVSVAGRDVRVVGTKFNIRRFNRKLTVTVTEGVVDVVEGADAEKSSNKSEDHIVEPIRLIAGIQLVHDEQTAVSIIQQVDAEAFTSWRGDVLSYEDVPLTDVINDIERYIDIPVVRKGDLSGTKFTGILNMTDPIASFGLIADILPVAVTITSERIIVRACDGCQ